MDARGGSNGEGRDERIPTDQDGPRLSRSRTGGRGGSGGGDPLLMAVPKGASDSDLIGAETQSTGGGDLDQGAYPAWSDAAPSTGAPAFCKFLKSIGPDGRLFDPRNDAVPTHRCAAFGDPLPLSLRQQELVCLQRVHVSCPRYMRGTLLAEESAAAAVETLPHTGPPYLTIAGLALVAIAGLAAIAGMLGLLPGTGSASTPTASPSLVAVASPSSTPTSSPTLARTASPTPTPTPTPSSSPSATPKATPTPTPTPVPSATWPPGATASRMSLLVPCTNQANCYVYTVRGPGPAPAGNGSKVADKLPGIANFFGVDINQIYNLNSWARSGIHPGDKLKIPSPTR